MGPTWPISTHTVARLAAGAPAGLPGSDWTPFPPNTNPVSLSELSSHVSSIDVSERGLATSPEGSAGGFGSLTDTVAVPDWSPCVAVMVAWTSLTPLTKPDELTVATAGAELLHETDGVTVAPALFTTVAES